MPLTTGTRLGPYEILTPIGAGGMGEVYRARDTRLNRDVAIKVVSEAFASDGERLARFTREAQTLASLNHPNIGAIYGLEEGVAEAGRVIRAIVMELVEGDDLSQRIARGPIPLDEALPIARQMAEALEAAHGQGIIHRDLKPANVKVRPDGTVKVLDFGLAKAMDPAGGSNANAMTSPTVSIHATHVGTILGTAAYMSPEQARGRAVDKRSDIWALGGVLFEMLTGRRAFPGDNVTDTIVSVVSRDPDWSALPPAVPDGIRRLLRRCLEKDPKRRLDSAGAARLEIDDALAASPTHAPPPTKPASRTRTTAALVSAFLLGAVVTGTSLWFTMRARPSASAPVSRTLISVSPADEIGGDEGRPNRQQIALSPNGRVLVFSATQGGRRQIYQRRLDELDAKPIAGTEGGNQPFFSPDGQWLGYWVDAELRRVPLAGGPSALVCKMPERTLPFGVAWGSDDRIVFGRRSGELWDVSASGGAAAALTKLDTARGEVSHRLPHPLPGGDAVLFTITRNRFPRWDETEVAVYSRRTGTSSIVVTGAADARYLPTGHIVYTREGVLMAAPFDLSRLAVTGTAVGVISSLMQAAYHGFSASESGATQLSIADTGAVAYVPGGAFPPAQRSVVRVDRSGRVESLGLPSDYYQHVRSSPDGLRLATGTTGRQHDVWVAELSRVTYTRLTTGGRNAGPVWTPDGRRIVYRSAQTGPDNLFWRSADGGEPERLTTSPRNQIPGAWTPNGHTLALYEISEERDALAYIWLLPIGAGPPARLTQSTFSEAGADFSPDGRWLAYTSNDSRGFQVYVQPYPGPGARIPISTDGGHSPVWRSDGLELFYQKLDPIGDGLQMMSVSITTTPTLRAGVPKLLFRGRYMTGSPARTYDVFPGESIVMLKHDERPAMPVSQIVLVQNWFDELKQIMTAK